MVIHYLIFGVLVLAAIFGLFAALQYARLGSDACEDYASKKQRGHSHGRYGESDYVKTYKKLYAPRGATTMALVLALNAVLTIPMLAVMNFLFEWGWQLGGQNRVYEPGYLVWQFMLFAGLIIGWCAITFAVLFFYHKRKVPSLDKALKALD